jgi:predicted metal-dependent phosphoesterase TrpH
MKTKTQPLLCELHAHTTWSDGSLTLTELVDLYGRSGFDVLCITDHACRDGRHVNEETHARYLGAIEAEATRAQAIYDLLVVPGIELTYDDPDPALGAHVVAVGLERFVPLDGRLEDVLADARLAGAALIGAHPYPPGTLDAAHRRTGRIAADWASLAPLIDRLELFNRHELFAWVADAGLPAVATGDFHEPEHLATWKSLLPCAKSRRAVVDYLRSALPVYLTCLGREPARTLAA